MGDLRDTSFLRRRRVLRVRCVSSLLAVAVTVAAGAFFSDTAAAPASAKALRADGRDIRSQHLHVTKHHRRRHVQRRIATRHPRTRGASVPLVFGIYPGGAAGTVGPSGRTLPEVADLRAKALRQLRGTRQQFVLHLYDSYTRPADAEAVPASLAAQIAAYAADGFQIELVLTYRPADPAGDATGFAAFIRARVRQLGSNPAVTSLQVTNEVNVTGAPDAADGAYPGARDALVQGVIAAADQARAGGSRRLRVGFNWAHQSGPAEAAFFAGLGDVGGAAFARAVDWVGIDAYPGTWGPKLARGDLATAVRKATISSLRTLRHDLLPRARLQDAAIHVSESGFPTGPGRTEAMQQVVLHSVIQTISDARAAYGVTDYRWFDLRDADSASTSFESRYGLTRDDYAPKPAFFAYRDLIAKLG